MAEKRSRKTRSFGKRRAVQALPFNPGNYLFFASGLIVIILGYVSLAQGPANSFWSLTLAPILLVVGYCVLIPLAIVYTGKVKSRE
ncbi:MAG: hypothetical protein ACE5HO_07165 [bacterium]